MRIRGTVTGQLSFGKVVSIDGELIRSDWSIPVEGGHLASLSSCPPEDSGASYDNSRTHMKTQLETSLLSPSGPHPDRDI
jgi:hypothetical protein